MPSKSASEQPLIEARMKTFPDKHPSFASVSQATSRGAPALLHPSEPVFTSTFQATICQKQATEPKRPEGKRMFVYTKATGSTTPNDFEARDSRVNQHVFSLASSGKW